MNLPWHRFHFIGIGGVGMSRLAHLLLALGYQVSGSDISVNPLIERLKNFGGRVFLGHNAEQIKDAQVVIYSSAIKDDNPELEAAKVKKIPIFSRGELLALFMAQKNGIAVAGTHGKTTTTAMIATILREAGLNPTAIIGGQIEGYGPNAWLGKGKYLVAEADESDGTFLLLEPEIAVVTNIDVDHLDYYKDINTIKTAFTQFLTQAKQIAIVCGDDHRLSAVVKKNKYPHLSYGLTLGQDIEARKVKLNANANFNLYIQQKEVGHFCLPMSGKHNIVNALAAIAVAKVLNIDIGVAISGLKHFKGVSRRFETKGEKKKILVMDDYAHHPAEIKAVLTAIKQKWPKRRLITIFQPHRYSRTQALYSSFLPAFNMANKLILTEIYPANESPIAGVTGQWLADGIAKCRPLYYCPSFPSIIDKLNELLKPNDIVLTLGAGNIWQIGEILLKKAI
jgi:UDP-N-acetylmuramate--alanine ligase